MKTATRYFAITGVLALLLASAASAQEGSEFVDNIERERLAQTGMKFLNISVSPRAAAMGSAATTHESSSMSMFYNPAGMGSMPTAVHVAFGQVQWIGDIDYNMAAIAFRPGQGNYGVVGLTLVAANYGDFVETIRFDNDEGYLRLGTFSPTAIAVGLGYARSLTDRFSVGAHAKYVHQELTSGGVMSYANESAERSSFNEGTMAFDFGVLYETGFRSLDFGMSVRNLSGEITYAEENFELPLTFHVGASMDMVDLTALNANLHSVLLSIDAERPRDYSEQLKAGVEYMFMNTFALRAGYTFPTDEQGINLGAGVQTGVSSMRIGVDYAYTQFGLFGNVNRFALHLGL